MAVRDNRRHRRIPHHDILLPSLAKEWVNFAHHIQGHRLLCHLLDLASRMTLR
ncbi:predicted protein [Plenodomus lingam JN3]|uniref:Predicted protein n=1 Tax=Leptosphaeria maculans (strain JN3 / isolate v23.1.3 / race Av1-4-5-6-7-8) TaxID=985895 RepID=E4ZNZ0_LEPMJ|nr:predicted protein [Plenodomus lingam JN3]CBX93359.1 predicted protein [Plenodomus lingam JN3]